MSRELTTAEKLKLADAIERFLNEPDDMIPVHRDVLVQILHCSQCGKHLYKPACGPTHALLKAHPEQHRDVEGQQ